MKTKFIPFITLLTMRDYYLNQLPRNFLHKIYLNAKIGYYTRLIKRRENQYIESKELYSLIQDVNRNSKITISLPK